MPSWLRSLVPLFAIAALSAISVAQVPPDSTVAKPDSAAVLTRPDTAARDTARTVSKPDTSHTAAKHDSVPPSPVSGMRNKLSADDLLSAESILEWHRQRYGEGGSYIAGLGWLARGALLTGDYDKAQRYTTETRKLCRDRLVKGANLEKDTDLTSALGAAIETEAQLRQRQRGKFAATKYLNEELEDIAGPVSLRSRLHKRLNLLSLAGTKAPALVVEDSLGSPVAGLAALRGKPVMLFVMAEWCGDCKAQAAGVARVRKQYAPKGLEVIALTRYYDEPEKRVTEKARVDSVWKAVYSEVGSIPIVLSTKSMETYGGSSTPTYVFVDKSGTVKHYIPTRLTEAEFDKRIKAIID